MPGEQVLLDADELAEGHDFFSLGTRLGEPRRPAAGLQHRHRRRRALPAAGQGPAHRRAAPRRGARTRWAAPPGTAAARTLFYTTVDDAWRPDKVWRHVLGTPVEDDVLVHHETDERFWTGVGRTRSDRFLVRASGLAGPPSEYAVLDADDPTGEFRVVAPRRDGVEYSVEHAVIARRGPAAGPAQRRRRELRARRRARSTPPRTSSGSRCSRTTRPSGSRTSTRSPATWWSASAATALTQLRIIALDDAADGLGEDFLVEFDEEVYTVGAGGNPEFGQPTVRLGYVTMADAVRGLRLRRRAPAS